MLTFVVVVIVIVVVVVVVVFVFVAAAGVKPCWIACCAQTMASSELWHICQRCKECSSLEACY